MRKALGELAESERRLAGILIPPVARATDWLFAIIGPAAIALGGLFIAWGFWMGVALILIGLAMTWVGWQAPVRIVKRRLERG